MIKTYRLINDINLTTPVLCAGKPKMVSFTGGMKNSGEEIRHGTFTTADEKMQKALEADSGYGTVFLCITPEPAAVPRQSEKSAEPASDAQAIGNMENNGPVPETTDVPGITNKQEAIEWLAANKGIDGLKPTCRVEAVRNAARLAGVEFPDWK